MIGSCFSAFTVSVAILGFVGVDSRVDGVLPPPTLTTVNPSCGNQAGGTNVNLLGSNFVSGATVTFDGLSAAVTFLNPSSLRAVSPAHAPGPVDLVITNPDGQHVSRAGGYTYKAPPTILNVFPNFGSTGGGTLVTVTGTNFDSSTVIFVGGAVATDIDFVDSTTIRGRAPPHAPGMVPVAVNNCLLFTLPNAFTYIQGPTVISVSPPSGPVAGGTPITLIGTNFISGATVTLGGIAATGVTFVSATQLTAVTPGHAAGAVNVVVTNPDSFSASLFAGFTYGSAPTLASVSPPSGSTAGGTAVTLTGTNFVTNATVTFGGVRASTAAVSDDRTISATTPGHAEGMVNVVVTNPDHQSATLPNAFAYHVPPSLTAINPTSGPASGGTTVSLNGSNFVSGATVTFGGERATPVTFTTSVITAVTPPHAGGDVSVVLTNPDGQSATLPAQFTYQGSVTSLPDGGQPPATNSGNGGGCNAGSSLPSLLGFGALLLWLRRIRRHRRLPRGRV